MKLSNVKISSHIISYGATKFLILITRFNRHKKVWGQFFLLHCAKLCVQSQKRGGGAIQFSDSDAI